MQLNKEQVKQLFEGITIRKKLTLVDQQLTYLFSLDVQDLKMIDFESDFTGSENITLKGMAAHDLVVFKTVEPRSVVPVAQVQLHEGWKLVTKFRFRRRPIPKDKQTSFLSSQLMEIENEKYLVDTVLKNIDANLAPMQIINQQLEGSKVKFIDNDFPPTEASIVGHSDKNLIDDTVNHWRRPGGEKGFFGGKPYQLIHRINCHHLLQGKLCDYSFYSVVVCLALGNESLIQGLFLNQNSINPNGIYKLRICKNGEWQTVIVDDLIPCEPFGVPKFARSTLNQIWFSLLQKAYAKLHRRYLNLHDLQVSNVLYDLTGCPTYIYSLESADIRATILQHFRNKNIVVFYDIEEKEFDEDQFIPLKNYAYPLLSFEEEDGSIYYKILSHMFDEKDKEDKRNRVKQIVELKEDELFKKFRYMCVCLAKNWEYVRIKGKFVTVETGTELNSEPISLSRWYYSLDLPQASQIHICLHQEDVLIGSNQIFKPYIYCSLLLLEKSDKSLLKPIQIQRFFHNREIHIKKQLPPGIYLIIPFINSESAIKKAPNEEEEIVDVFRKLDLLMGRQLKYADLAPFYKVCGQVFSEQIFSEVLKKYAKGRKGIGLQAFKEMWRDNHLYWSKGLQYYQKQRLFTLSVHSNNQINILIKNNISTEFNNRAHCELILKLGKQMELLPKAQQRLARIIYLQSKSNIVEYMVENKHERKIQIQLDCTESKGYEFIPKNGKCIRLLDSGQKEFVMKLLPLEKCEVKDLVRVEKLKVKTFD